jgi:hypothetical protein
LSVLVALATAFVVTETPIVCVLFDLVVTVVVTYVPSVPFETDCKALSAFPP